MFKNKRKCKISYNGLQVNVDINADTDVVLLTYDMQENQMMDFYTNLIKRIKAAVPHKNVALVGNNYQSFTFTSRRVSLIME